MNKLEEDCRGCRDFSEGNLVNQLPCRSGVKPSFTIWCKEIKCPCRTCIVKGICKEGCSNMKNYIKLFSPYKTWRKKWRLKRTVEGV